LIFGGGLDHVIDFCDVSNGLEICSSCHVTAFFLYSEVLIGYDPYHVTGSYAFCPVCELG